VRFVKGYAPKDPRPVWARTLEAAVAASRRYERVGLELSMGTQGSDRMVGEPTTFTRDWFRAWRRPLDAMPVLNAARAIKTPQEIERIRLANDICANAMRHAAGHLRPGMKESEAAALWQEFVHGEGTGWRRKVDLALGFSLVWSGAGIRTFTATGHRPVQRDQPTLFEIWVCADGYWCDHTKLLCPGELRDDYRELERGLMDVYARAIDHCRPGASLAELDRLIRNGITDLGYPSQPTHPVCHGVGARAHEPPYAHQAGGGTIEENMVLAIEPGCYRPGGGGLRVEDNFLITPAGAQKLSSFPDGVVRCG
jgi:Xaa-Pro dipeptidase